MHLTEIYDQYYQRVRKFILHTVRNEWVADDLVQETFIRINHNLETSGMPLSCKPGYLGLPTISARIISASKGKPLIWAWKKSPGSRR